MKTLTKKHEIIRKIFSFVTKTVDNVAGLYDKVKMDDETRKLKKKALKVLLYSLLILFIAFSVDILSTLFLEAFQKFVMNLGIDPRNGVVNKILNFIEVASILVMITSSIAVIGNKRCSSYVRSSFDDSSIGPHNPTSIWQSRRHSK